MSDQSVEPFPVYTLDDDLLCLELAPREDVPELLLTWMNDRPRSSRETLEHLYSIGVRFPAWFYATNEATRRCQSPIERCFVEGFSQVCLVIPHQPDHECIRAIYDRKVDMSQRVHVLLTVQPKVATESRVLTPDFLLQIIDQAHQVAAVYIECDGHEFHAATKEQVTRDRKRERDILASGHQVIRFTGTELWRDARGCVMDAMRVLFAIQEGKLK